MDDSQFRQLLAHFGLSWAGYRKVRKGVKKRLGRHMQETGCQSVADYICAIESDPETRLRFECLTGVSISRFFRDRGLWRKLQERILPVLAKSPRLVKVWSAGCASGEEVYSFRILWEDMRKFCASLPDLSILATDICPEYLNRGRAAIYSSSSLKEVPGPILRLYFEKAAGGKYAVGPWIKEGISWQVHNLLSDPVGTGFDLVFLRNNLLTYYMDEVRIPAFLKVVESLAPGGYLIIGSHESMPVEPGNLDRLEDTGYIFRKLQ
jgi:chemotaxis methyl-accepting protein methylase